MLSRIREHWLATLLVIGIGSGVYFNFQDTREVNALRQENLTAQCERGNVVRAYLIVDAGRNAKNPEGRQAAARRAFPILDCETGKPGPPPNLPPAEQQEYIENFEAKYPVGT